MKKTFILLSCFLGLSLNLLAQEHLLPLMGNPVLLKSATTQVPLKSGTALALPFLDDFSYESWAPDPGKWQDRWAFVNRTFGPLPPTLGMATLDALDDTGAVYSWATATPFQADYLTSQPLRLDSILDGSPDVMQLSDSIYLSFYYQPQGIGNYPDEDDSLILEFYDPTSDDWYKMWSVPGISYETFHQACNCTFKLVMIPVLDTMFLKNGFEFRFRNYASIANANLPSWQSNMDQWNVDYVYLNYNRHKNDTTSADIAFVSPPQPLLKNYVQMPARQFTGAELRDTLNNVISNLNNTLNNISYQYTVKEEGGPFTHTYLGGDFDILPFITNGYHSWPFHTDPAVDFTLPAFSTDSLTFTVTHAIGINGWADKNLTNDTMRFKQDFFDYYAYDDGTAEAGYGLAGSGSRFAYGFNLNTPDTLTAVQMFFNQTFTPPSSRYFYLMVWQSLEPEVVLYKSKRVRPINGDSLNAFHTYNIEDSIIVLNGSFYVGWMQTTDEVLNIGFDRNNNASSHVRFNTEGVWENTVFNGAVMMRPVLGDMQAGKKSALEFESDKLAVLVYPNPVYGNQPLHLMLPVQYQSLDPENTMTIEIYNLQGRRLYEGPFSETVDVNFLEQGYYFLRVNSYSSGERCVKTFSIAR